MAAEPRPDWLSRLPSAWSYGVLRDGRIFFINEQAQSTTWLHPVSGEAVVTGHRKTPDLPTGWEEGYTFEGARCFINHNERKVTCKHPLSGAPSQDNCIFVVNEQPAPPVPSEQSAEHRERPTSILSDNGGSDLSPATSVSTATSPCPGTGLNNALPQLSSAPSAASRPSRSSKKVHNFGKRSNSIKRNVNAPVVKRGWIYKQDSTGMKLWKKRWFVLCDMCLFYYRDDKEDNVLGSILLPSFHISMLSVDDHINRKYAFKATHPNMRTYYFCSDSAKDSESWMKVMTDAALVHTEPLRRSAEHLIDTVNADLKKSEKLNNQHNQRALTCPEIQNNQRNCEPMRQPSCTRGGEKHGEKAECYTLHRDGDDLLLRKDGVSYMLQKDGDRYVLHKDGEQFFLKKNGDKYSLQRDEPCALHPDLQRNSTMKNHLRTASSEKKYTQVKERPKLLLVNETHTLPAQHTEGHRFAPEKEVRRQLSLRETDRSMFSNNKYGTIHVMDRYGTLKEVKKYSTLREGDRYATLKDADMYSLHRDPSAERTKLSIQLQPTQAAAIAAVVSASRQNQKVNGSVSAAVDQPDGSSRLLHPPALPTDTAPTLKTSLSRTHSMPPMEPWARPYRAKADPDTTSISSYQTLPRNMPSHRSQMGPHFPEGYRTLPRNSLCRPDSVCAANSADKRRSMKDDTMWQLYEWQQRQAYSRLSTAPPTGAGHYSTLPSSKTMSHLRESIATPIPTSPSHGSLYSTLPPPRLKGASNPSTPHSELSSPVLRDGTATLGRPKTLPLKLGYPERFATAVVSTHNITPQSLQGKTSEELTLLLIKLRRQQAELSSLREHTLAQLRALGSEGPNAKTDVLSHHLQRSLRYLDSQKKDNEPLIFMIHTMIENSAPRPQLYQHVSPEAIKSLVSDAEDPDIDTKLSRLCEQDKVVKTHEEKVQQLHREKHTLETALLSASQELNEQSLHSAQAQSLLQQRDILQGGLLSTCRELNRVIAELQLSKQEYQRLEGDVSQAKTSLLQQLEALGSPQTEPPSQRHIQIQKELWRIQDVMEALAKHKSQAPSDCLFPSSKPLSSISKNEGPDYRLYKSEPELTTVKEEEPDEPHPDERGGAAAGALERRDTPVSKVTLCPVGIVPPRTKCSISAPESSTIASYVTLRKSKKPEPRTERPHSALDQAGGFGERELGRSRMSVEEQLERIRRNKEASTLKRSRLSRSSSFNRDEAFAQITQGGGQTEGPCTDPCGLQTALQRLKDMSESLSEGGALAPEQVEDGDCSKGGTAENEELQQLNESNDPSTEECERQTAVILELPRTVKVVELQPFEDLSSATSPSDHSLQTPELEWSAEVREELRADEGGDSELRPEEIHLNNLLPAQTMALVSSDT
ncbi:pleckstrin homology domain-containing family A member 5-like isoform X5 [Periophthalmus magnuspinnatus]|uniref:pleckstrin homology domain-containing family A member 5-like isoform X5 n=1 Tax=Periophthalmus magnuspinnatus TaxID=409849 RepID=UPI0024371847|nr:pleckstrin homology domain-containing family A member 5-like isoform X5 [Periophthalmus magnuspinnatus]